MSKYILGIDPGTTQTAYCLCTRESVGSKPLRISEFAKTDNDKVKKKLSEVLEMVDKTNGESDADELTVAIEHLESYGTAVGRSTFETAYFIGRLTETVFPYTLSNESIRCERIYRHEEKMLICHSMKANDATIKQALVDRFADHPDVNHGKGRKDTPDFFYGFKADCWSAFAICCTQLQKELGDCREL